MKNNFFRGHKPKVISCPSSTDKMKLRPQIFYKLQFGHVSAQMGQCKSLLSSEAPTASPAEGESHSPGVVLCFPNEAVSLTNWASNSVLQQNQSGTNRELKESITRLNFRALPHFSFLMNVYFIQLKKNSI